MLHHIKEPERKYVTLDDANARRLAEQDPALFFETYVVTEIIKSYYNAGRQSNLYYYRGIDKKEIDLLIVEGDKLYPIEVKKGKVPKSPDKNFKVLEKFKKDVQPGIILCMSDELIPYNRESWYCPAFVL